MSVRAVISDLGKVLLEFDHMISCRAVSDRCGLGPEEVYERIFRSDPAVEYELGRISSEAFADRVRKILGLDAGREEIRRWWTEIFEPMDEMEELVRSLAGRYSLVLLSNTNPWHFEFCLERFPVVGLFDAYALSYRVGRRKPAPEIFGEAVRLAGCAPGECVYIDDIPEYVEAASALGLQGIPFESPALLRETLLRLGVDCS